MCPCQGEQLHSGEAKIVTQKREDTFTHRVDAKVLNIKSHIKIICQENKELWMRFDLGVGFALLSQMRNDIQSALFKMHNQ